MRAKLPPPDAEGRVEGARHGDYLGYASDGCRCVACKVAKAAHARERRGSTNPRPAHPPVSSFPDEFDAWEHGYDRGRRDGLGLALALASAQAPAFARQLRVLAATVDRPEDYRQEADRG